LIGRKIPQMDKIDPKSLNFAEVRKLLSELESAEREARRFSSLFRELIVKPLVDAAKSKGVDVAEFPRLTGRPPVVEARHKPSKIPPRQASNLKTGTHPFLPRARRCEPKSNAA
jgi:Fe-S-cluster formation regulator IscX/YfhJ